jgi:hypothetical protein
MDYGLTIVNGYRYRASCMRSIVTFALTPADDLCCVWFIYPTLCPETDPTSRQRGCPNKRQNRNLKKKKSLVKCPIFGLDTKTY